MTRRARFPLAVLAVFLLALAMRTLVLYRSPLPFNPDGIHHAQLASEAVASGRLPLARMGTDDLHFEALLATVSTVTGVSTLRVAQPASAVVGAAPAILGVAVARRLSLRRGWGGSRARVAAIVAGLLLAVEGLYLHRSMATDEQTVGLFLVPLAVVAASRGSRTGRTAWWVVAAGTLVALPPVHNLDATVAALSLVVLVVLGVVWRPFDARRRRLAVLTGAFVLALPAYHVVVERLTPARILQEARLTDVPGLLLAWAVAIALLSVVLVRSSARTQRVVGWSVAGTLFGLLALNATTTVFPGTPATPKVLLTLLFPLAIPVALAVWGGPESTTPDDDGGALVALGGGVFVLVGVSVTASLTPEYLATAYRSTTFLHFPVLVAAGIGVAALLGRSPSADRPTVRVVVVALVVVAAATSIPVAFGGLTMLPYKGVTTTGEYAASEFAATNGGSQWAGDDHIVRIGPFISPGSNGSRRPAFRWLAGRGDPPDCLTVVQRSWTTTGAQFYPAPPARLSVGTYRAWRASSSVVYHGGGGDPIRAGIPRSGRGGTC